MPLQPCEDNEKVVIYEVGNRPSLGTKSINIQILEFSDVITVRSIFLLFIGYLAMVFCYSNPNNLKHRCFLQ